MDIASVLGIGVAVRVRISVSDLSDLRVSLCLTPNRCSSSIMTNPRFLNLTSFDNSLCVPMTISTRPEANSSSVLSVSFFVRKRESSRISIGKFEKRSEKV